MQGIKNRILFLKKYKIDSKPDFLILHSESSVTQWPSDQVFKRKKETDSFF